MKRLTKWHDTHVAVICENCDKQKECRHGDAGISECHEVLRNRLAAYEDTGLEPEEILIGKELAEVACAMNLLKEYQAIGPIDHMQELAQAEKDGRLVVLPCRVGDTVYIIRNQKIIIAEVEAMHQWVSGKWKLNVHSDKRYQHWVGYEIFFDDFGKTVFLTREEAEAALKKREEANNEAD